MENSLDILRRLFRGAFRDNYYKIKETMRDDGKIDLPSDDDFHRFRDEDDLSFMRRFWFWEEWRELYFNICDECERVLAFGD